MKKKHQIKEVKKNSIAAEVGLVAGDVLLRINGTEIEDLFDYYYAIQETELVLEIEKQNGEEWEIEIEKEESQDLGLLFLDELMDAYRSCKNRCIFCFIDQMPPGMRKTLYFKDDDARLSFLQGNYITLTNLSDRDIERIIQYRLSPIQISIHTMNPQLRCRMLQNRFAGEALKKLQRFYDAQIEMNAQIVCCKGYNDGKELEETLAKLTDYIPYLKTVSVVPVGLTKYRDHLTPLEAFQEEDAKAILRIIHRQQKICRKQYHTNFVYASDEWYLTAKEPIPKAREYEGFGQIENGVGMIRSFLEEFQTYERSIKPDQRKRTVSIATGVLAAPMIQDCLQRISQKFPFVTGTVYPIQNHFFGEKITVAGLLTGQDIFRQLKGKPLGEVLLLPDALLRAGEQTLLDDMTISDLEHALQIPIHTVQSDGKQFIDAVLGNDRSRKEE